MGVGACWAPAGLAPHRGVPPAACMEPAQGKALGCGCRCLAMLLTGLAAAFCLLAYTWPCGPGPAACRATPGQDAAAVVPGQARPQLLVVLWTWPFGHHFRPRKCSAPYGIPDCHFTTNHSRHAVADAIIVHHRGVCSGPKQLPQGPRVPSQRWIWFNLESPSHSANLGALNNLFNLTMSYRRDSDIFSPYGELQLLGQPQPFSVPPKAKLVAWVVSNRQADSHRVKYYQELKQHIAVDVYGQHHQALARDQLLTIMAQYKFYLVFENSQHEDYITEKVWRNALSAGTVPVVLGPPRENYERFLPPDAFIHIDDFASARDLARYLQELSEDAKRYERYFQWRQWLKPVAASGWDTHLCWACQFLQTMGARYQVVRDLSMWFV